MEPETINKSSRALSKEEIRSLLFLIENSKIINNKKTNATTNRMKNDEWERISETLNATIAPCRRTPQQLRLKWENLKKKSRKRSARIRMERIKTGGGPPPYFPPDEILDRVAALLGTTGEGLPEMFGGDAEMIFADFGECGDSSGGGDSAGGGGSGGGDSAGAVASVVNDDTLPTNSFGAELELATSSPIRQKKSLIPSGVKRRIRKCDKCGCQARNLAIEEYFKEKKKLLETKLENIKLMNENLKLQNEQLKLDMNSLV